MGEDFIRKDSSVKQLHKGEMRKDRDLITDIKITTDGVRLRKIDKNGKQSEVLVNWEEISDYIKKIFDDY